MEPATPADAEILVDPGPHGAPPHTSGSGGAGGGSPVGRRVVLGLLAAGAVGVLAGARIQNWLERAVAPIVAKDGTGLSSLLPIGRFRIYSVTGSLPSRDPADY